MYFLTCYLYINVEDAYEWVSTNIIIDAETVSANIIIDADTVSANIILWIEISLCQYPLPLINGQVIFDHFWEPIKIKVVCNICKYESM